MKCPKCGSVDDKVVDSRLSRTQDSIRRRRECLACAHRFTTYEAIETENLRVVKADGRYEDFDRHKLRHGLQRACEKRPVSQEQIDDAVEEIVAFITREHGSAVPSRLIGACVMDKLRQLDEVAYVRYASVYRRFEDIEEFAEEIAALKARGPVSRLQPELPITPSAKR
jgi:transcriptional repressor NrdR